MSRSSPKLVLQDGFNVVTIPFEEFLYMQKVAQGTMHAALVERNPAAQADVEQVFMVSMDPTVPAKERGYATISAFCLIDAHDSIAMTMGKPSSVEEQAKRNASVTVDAPMSEGAKVGVTPCGHPPDVPCEKCGAGAEVM